MIAKQLRKDGQLSLELGIAKELGYTLSELREKMLPEELWLWAAYFQIQQEEQQASLKRSQRRR